MPAESSGCSPSSDRRARNRRRSLGDSIRHAATPALAQDDCEPRPLAPRRDPPTAIRVPRAPIVRTPAPIGFPNAPIRFPLAPIFSPHPKLDFAAPAEPPLPSACAVADGQLHSLRANEGHHDQIGDAIIITSYRHPQRTRPAITPRRPRPRVAFVAHQARRASPVPPTTAPPPPHSPSAPPDPETPIPHKNDFTRNFSSRPCAFVSPGSENSPEIPYDGIPASRSQ